MIMGAVRQTFQPQLDSKSNRPIEMTSRCLSKTTNVFVFERGSREYLAQLNRSPEERVMTNLRKLRAEERMVQRERSTGRSMI